MARLPDVPNALRVGFSGTLNNTPWMVTMHLSYSGPSLDTTGLNSLCATLAQIWDGAFRTIQLQSTVLRTVEAWDLTSAAGAYGSTNVNLPGTIAGGGMANQSALCISWKVNYRWRGGHPRSYLPPPSSAETTGGKNWSAAYQASAQTQARLFRDNVNATIQGSTGIELVAIRYQSKDEPTKMPLVLPIADALVHSRIDSQRRRLGKEVI